MTVHLAGLPLPRFGTRGNAPAWRLLRSRVPGVHRVLVRAVQEAMRLESRVGNPRSGQKGDQRLHRPLPPPAPLRAGLPNTRQGRRDLARHARPTQRSDLNRQRERGPHHPLTAVLARPVTLGSSSSVRPGDLQRGSATALGDVLLEPGDLVVGDVLVREVVLTDRLTSLARVIWKHGEESCSVAEFGDVLLHGPGADS